mgnify:FL=1
MTIETLTNTASIYTDALSTEQAFTRVFESHHRRLYFAAYKVVRDCAEPASTARDIVADAFTKAWAGREDFRAESGLYTFLFRCTVNGALDHIKAYAQAKRSHKAPSDDAASGLQAVAAESTWLPSDVTPRGFGNPEQAFLRKERAALVADALATLPARERDAWQLVRVDGLSSVKAAAAMGMSQPTCYRAVKAADAAVKSHLSAMCA